MGSTAETAECRGGVGGVARLAEHDAVEIDHGVGRDHDPRAGQSERLR